MQNLFILLEFLLITIALLIAVSIYCYMIKYRAKQKHLLPLHNTNNEFYINKFIIKMESNVKLKEIDIKNRACYYFDHIIKIEDFDLDNILIDEKSYENILIYSISNKS